MKQKIGIGAPEAAGFCVLGGTLGAVLAGSGEPSFDLPVLMAAAGGGLLLPLAVILPWRRLFRRKLAARREALSG